MKVSVIIPVYNEFRTLPQVLDRVWAAPLPEGCTKEIIVVDDGSTDGTSSLLDQWGDRGLLVVHHSILNFGKGTAIRVGLSIASGDVILIQDGDLEYDPQDYTDILQPIVNGQADVVYGSRFLGNMSGMHWKNWLANRILTITTNLLYGAGITDEATAYKAFRTNLLRQVRLECRRFEFCPEATAKVCRLGVRIHEVPISYNARGIEQGKKIRAFDGFHALWTLFKCRILPGAMVVAHPAASPSQTVVAPPVA